MSTPSHDSGTTDLSFEKVSFSYGAQRILEEASFHIHRGEFIALVGPNGAGKTTVLKLILGLAQPDAGSVRLFGRPPFTVRNRVGYVPQLAAHDPSFPVPVREVVRMGLVKGFAGSDPREDRRLADEAMTRAGVSSLAEKDFSTLSGGERRRVLVARALAPDPHFLVLDEPTANMDAQSETRLFDTLQSVKGAVTILIVTHDTAFVSGLTDRVLCVSGRSVVRHRLEPAGNAPPQLFGGAALKVLHDEDLPADDCCPVPEGKK